MDNEKRADDTVPLVSSLSLFNKVMSQSVDSLYFKDVDLRFIYVNRNKAIRHGVNSPSDMIGKTDFDYISASDATELSKVEKLILETGQPIIGMIEKLTRLDGRTTWASSTKYPLSDDNGRIIGIWGISRDITEYELDKEALRESEERYSQLSKQSRAFTWELDEHGLFTYVDLASENILGYRPDELIGKKHFYDLIPEKDRKVTRQSAFDVFTHKELFQNLENKTQAKDGHTVWLSINGIPMLNEDGTLRGYRGSNTDITERKTAEEALKSSQRQLKDIIEFLPDATLAVDIENRVIIWNKAIEKMTGIPASEMIGKGDHACSIPFYGEAKPNLMDLVLLEDEETISRYPGLIREDDTLMAEVFCPALHNKTGAWVFSKASPLHDQAGSIIGAIEIIRDITDNKQTVDMLRSSEEKFRSYTEKAPLGIFITNGQGQYIEVNQATCQMSGYTEEELLNLTIKDFMAPESLEQTMTMFQQMMTEGYTEGDLLGQKKNCEKYWINLISVRLSDNRVIGFCKDITVKKKAEDQILYLSFHDQLTGLYNRRFYEEELIRLDTRRNLPLTIVMGDVNGLKLINDSFGHTMGDELLRKAAAVVKSGCRADDIIARLGGDEFIALLPQTNGDGAEQIISRINELLLKEKVGTLGISISFGYSTKYSENENIQETFKYAEDLMYRNKRSERSGIRSKTIDLVLDSLYKKSNREQLHSVRVSEICEAIAAMMDFSENDVYQIKIAGLMHDIGKIEIDEKTLNKPEKLSKEEWEKMQRHPEIGYRILSSVSEFSGIANDVLEHHERWDGKGYPRGLKGDESSLFARIIAIADAYEAMTSDRIFGKALSRKDAISEMIKCAGTQFDPRIVRVLIEKVLGEKWQDTINCH